MKNIAILIDNSSSSKKIIGNHTLLGFQIEAIKKMVSYLHSDKNIFVSIYSYGDEYGCRLTRSNDTKKINNVLQNITIIGDAHLLKCFRFANLGHHDKIICFSAKNMTKTQMLTILKDYKAPELLLDIFNLNQTTKLKKFYSNESCFIYETKINYEKSNKIFADIVNHYKNGFNNISSNNDVVFNGDELESDGDEIEEDSNADDDDAVFNGDGLKSDDDDNEKDSGHHKAFKKNQSKRGKKKESNNSKNNRNQNKSSKNNPDNFG